MSETFAFDHDFGGAGGGTIPGQNGLGRTASE
jgi:hypothetical protein